MDNGGPYGAPQDALTLWKFSANFTTPALSTFTLANTIPIAAIRHDALPSASGRACIPQPGTTQQDRPPWLPSATVVAPGLPQLRQPRIAGDQPVRSKPRPPCPASAGGKSAAPTARPVVYQESTYAPGLTDGIHRWMGIDAKDNRGNLRSASARPAAPSPSRARGTPAVARPTGRTRCRKAKATFFAGTGCVPAPATAGATTAL